MARPAYSTCLVDGFHGSGVNALDTVPIDEVWVVRCMMATFGSYAGYVQAALGLTPEGPWQWLCQNPSTRLFGIQKQTFVWEGRYVIPPGYTLYMNTSSGDTCDLKLDGYVLSRTGSIV